MIPSFPDMRRNGATNHSGGLSPEYRRQFWWIQEYWGDSTRADSVGTAVAAPACETLNSIRPILMRSVPTLAEWGLFVPIIPPNGSRRPERVLFHDLNDPGQGKTWS